MRADRLLSLLMLLQTRGQMTARELAEELEVSERTIYRDIDALSAAGVPVYAVRGPGGGCALMDGYRTDLTGLTRDEVRALFMLSVPAPLADLGLSRELRAALRKLSAALPVTRRADERRMRERVHLDSVWWYQQEEPVPYLRTIQEKVAQVIAQGGQAEDLQQIDIESCGKSRIPLNGLVTDLHTANLHKLYQQMANN